MGSSPAFQMYTGEWLKTAALSKCEPATRGIWIDLCCAIWDADDAGAISGTVRQLSRACRCDRQEMQAAIDELEANDVAEVEEADGVYTIVSRRLRKQLAEMHSNRERQRKHRSKRKSNGGSNGKVTPDVTRLSEEGRLKSEEGRLEREEGSAEGRRESEHWAISALREASGEAPSIMALDQLPKIVTDKQAWGYALDRAVDRGWAWSNVPALIDAYRKNVKTLTNDGTDKRPLTKSQLGQRSVGEVLAQFVGHPDAADFTGATTSYGSAGSGTGVTPRAALERGRRTEPGTASGR